MVSEEVGDPKGNGTDSGVQATSQGFKDEIMNGRSESPENEQEKHDAVAEMRPPKPPAGNKANALPKPRHDRYVPNPSQHAGTCSSLSDTFV